MTSYVVNWAGIDAATDMVLTIAANPAATDAANGGIYMSANLEWFCSASSPGAYDTFINGIAVSPADAMRVLMCATADGPPAGFSWVRGLPVSASGQLCLTSDGTPDHWVAGWPVDSKGLVCAAEVLILYLLLESGDFLLLESGDKIDIE